MITKRKNDSSIYTVIIPLIDNVEIVISSIGYIIILKKSAYCIPQFLLCII